MEIAIGAVCLWAVREDSNGQDNGELTAIIACLGTLSVLALSAFAANAFVSERVSQTLEVLLTTPLVARDIVRQKARMLTRFMWVLAVPLATVCGIEAWIEDGTWHVFLGEQARASSGSYLVWAAMTLAIYLPLVLWLSLWIGLKMRTRFRAIPTALGVIVVWCVLPIVIGVICRIDSRKPESFLMAFSPLAVPAVNEFGQMWEIFPTMLTLGPILNFLFYGILVLVFRALCLRRADRYLRR